MKMFDVKYALGLDFGTDSVRALVVNALQGKEVGTAVSEYKMWEQRKFCDAATDRYRQHPEDHIDSMVEAVAEAIRNAKRETGNDTLDKQIQGIGIDTTGSTPIAVDRKGTPLALLDEFKDNAAAMFILWKDHTALAEAEEINDKSKQTNDGFYTRFCGGTYSAEWFWSKILHTMRTADQKLVRAAYSFIEQCDWIPAVLTGTNPLKAKISRCAAGHKALWHDSWDGLPFKFLTSVDKGLGKFKGRLYSDTYTSDQVAGKLTGEWASLLGLRENIPVAVGAFDAHMGAVGNGIRPGVLSRIVGTSTCDMAVAPYDKMRIAGDKEITIKGICGQVDGSIIPGMFGLEAGQSAVGDIFANYRNWFVRIANSLGLSSTTDSGSLQDNVYKVLTERAVHINP